MYKWPHLYIKPKFTNSRQIMNYWLDCLLSDLQNKINSWFILFKSTQFDLKSINGIWIAIAQEMRVNAVFSEPCFTFKSNFNIKTLTCMLVKNWLITV